MDEPFETYNTATHFTFDTADWEKPTAYRCIVCLIEEEDGGFSAVCLNLPGACSCGDTEEKALENVREAITGVIKSYLENGEKIPWDNFAQDIPNCTKKVCLLIEQEVSPSNTATTSD